MSSGQCAGKHFQILGGDGFAELIYSLTYAADDTKYLHGKYCKQFFKAMYLLQ